MQRPEGLSDSTLPVAEALFAQIIGCAPQEVAPLVGALSEPARARLALFCNARAHLRQIGHAIADTCSEGALLREGGQAGAFLFDRSTRELDRPHQFTRVARRVSLAEGKRLTAA
jgi:hypothetical protein